MEPRPAPSAISRFAKIPRWLHACILFVVVFLAFAPALSFDFITYDDPEFIVDNPNVNTGLNWANLKWAFASPGEVNLWNPLTSLSHQLDVSLFGLNPAWHHAVNLFWHALAASLLFLICRKLLPSIGWCYFIVLLWAIHPQKIQSVVWISERKAVLSGALFFASILFFAVWVTRSRRSPTFYLLSLLFFIAAALAKPSVLPLPLVLFALFALKPDKIVASTLASLRQLTPFFIAALVVAALVIFFRNQGTLSEVGSSEGPFERFRQGVMSYTFYLTRFAFPVPSQLLFTPPTSQLPFIVSLLSLGLFLTAVTWFGRQNTLILLGAFIYTLLWLPISGVIPISHYFVADRYSYLPQIGIILMLVGAAQIVSSYWPQRLVLPLLFSTLVGGHLVLLQMHLPLWQNSETLFGHEMRVNPRSSLAPVHYGEFFRQDDPEKALGYYQMAHQKAPHEGMPPTKMGLMQLRLKRPDEALASFLRATRVSHPVPETWTQLLLLQVELKLYSEAEATVNDGVQSFPNDWPMMMNGANFYLLVKKDPKKALPLFLKAHEIKPSEVDSIRACARCYRVLADTQAAERFERLLPKQ